MYWISRYLDPWPWPKFLCSSDFYTFYVTVPLSFGCMIRKVSAEDIAIRGNGTGLEYMCPTRHFVYIFFNPVFQVSTAKNEINLFNNHILIVAPVTFAPAGAMTPSAEFLFIVLVGPVRHYDHLGWGRESWLLFFLAHLSKAQVELLWSTSVRRQQLVW